MLCPDILIDVYLFNIYKPSILQTNLVHIHYTIYIMHYTCRIYRFLSRFSTDKIKLLPFEIVMQWVMDKKQAIRNTSKSKYKFLFRLTCKTSISGKIAGMCLKKIALQICKALAETAPSGQRGLRPRSPAISF